MIRQVFVYILKSIKDRDNLYVNTLCCQTDFVCILKSNVMCTYSLLVTTANYNVSIYFCIYSLIKRIVCFNVPALDDFCPLLIKDVVKIMYVNK